MANVKTTLTVEGNGNTNSFSNTKNYSEEVVTKYYVDNSDGFTDIIVFSPDDDSPTKTATSTGAPQSFCLYNSGSVGLEIQIQNTKWAHAAPDTVDSEAVFNSFILGAGEMFFSNNMRLMQRDADNSGALGAECPLRLMTSLSGTLDATHSKGGDMGADTDTEDASSSASIALDGGGAKFRTGDYIFFDTSTSDAMKVVSVSGNTLTVERNVLGYTAQTIPDNTDVFMYAGTHLHDKGTEDDSGTNIRTDAQGRFKGQLLGVGGDVPRGTGATNVAGGIVPGSAVIQFPESGGYQNLGVAVGSTDSTGLAVSTAYEFRITDSLVTTADIAFTTDSSDVSWGKVIELINQAFVDASLDYTVGIVNGDVRFSAKKWIDGDSITLADPSDGTEPWGVGNVPDTAAHETPVKTRFPSETITDIGSGKSIKNTTNMLIDDGNGNLVGEVGSGTINYDSGVVDFTGLYRAEFKTAFAYGSAHSGIPTRAANTSNMAKTIAARSNNVYKNGELTLICYS